jgi:hypothetical protein
MHRHLLNLLAFLYSSLSVSVKSLTKIMGSNFSANQNAMDGAKNSAGFGRLLFQLIVIFINLFMLHFTFLARIIFSVCCR